MKLNFIVTTLNGYVIERVEIGDYTKESINEILDKLYSEEFTSKHIGEFNYIDDVAGNTDDVGLTEKGSQKAENERETDKEYKYQSEENEALEDESEAKLEVEKEEGKNRKRAWFSNKTDGVAVT